MSNTFRTTISVPQDLKKRMDAADEQVNWSAVACRAFEAKLAEIASKKVRKSMSDVIQRLRGSKQRTVGAQYRDGEAAGIQWAKAAAEVDELARLERHYDACRQDWDALFADDSDSAYSVAQQLFFVLHPESSRQDADDFWRDVLGDDASQADDSAFVKGFAEGALSVWDEVKDQL